MKSLKVILAFVLVLTSNFVFSQDTISKTYPKFLGIPIGLSIEETGERLVEKGYIKLTSTVFEGTFIGEDAQLILLKTNTQLVYTVGVVLYENESPEHISEKFRFLETELTKKYGSPKAKDWDMILWEVVELINADDKLVLMYTNKTLWKEHEEEEAEIKSKEMEDL